MADRTEIKPVGVKPVAEAKASTAPAAKPVASAAPAAPALKPAAEPAKPVAAAPKAPAPAKPAPVVMKAAPAPAKSAPAPVAKPVSAPVSVKPAAKPLTEGKPVMATKSFSPNFTTFLPTPENMQSLFGDLQSRAKASMEKSAKVVEDMSEFTKGNVEAVMTSSRVAVKGAETMGQDAAEYSKKSFESAAAAFKSMVAAKSPTELFTLQSDYARKAFDTAVAEGSKFSEAWLKLAGDIVQPLSTRVAMAAEKMKV